MTRIPVPSGALRNVLRCAAIVAASLIVAGGTVSFATATPARAASSPASAAPVISSDSLTDASPAGPAITWSVAPATESGVDTTREFFDFSAKRGVGMGDHVAVTNYSTQPVDLHVYAADGTTDFKTAKLTLIDGTKASKDLGSWVSVGRGPSSCPASDTGSALAACVADLGIRVTVQPNTSMIIPFRIQVPENATAGDHVAGIVAAYTQKGSGNRAVAVEERVGARIFVRVAGKLTPGLSTSGAVASFSAPANPFANGTATVGFDLKDTGNTRLSALPTFNVTGIFGIPAGTATAKPVENLLPGGVAHVQATVKDVPRLFLLFGGITVTPQRADGDVGADTPPVAVHDTAITWAIPWIWLIIAVVVAGIVLAIIWWRRRSNERLAAALHQYALQVQAEAEARQSELVDHGGSERRP
jgi:hypothetical protein